MVSIHSVYTEPQVFWCSALLHLFLFTKHAKARWIYNNKDLTKYSLKVVSCRSNKWSYQITLQCSSTGLAVLLFPCSEINPAGLTLKCRIITTWTFWPTRWRQPLLKIKLDHCKSAVVIMLHEEWETQSFPHPFLLGFNLSKHVWCHSNVQWRLVLIQPLLHSSCGSL